MTLEEYIETLEQALLEYNQMAEYYAFEIDLELDETFDSYTIIPQEDVDTLELRNDNKKASGGKRAREVWKKYEELIGEIKA